jgi:transposase
MPITLNVPDWGEVQAVTLREVAKRLDVSMNDVQYWVDCDLFESYEWNTMDTSGKLKKQVIYVDLVDLAEVEKLARRFPEDSPWERILWFRYEQRQARLHQQKGDKRSVERTMVQPQRLQRPIPRPQRRGPLPRELREVEDEVLLERLEGQQPSRSQAKRLAHAGQGRQTIEEDDYYAEANAPTVKETGHYPREKKGIFPWQTN